MLIVKICSFSFKRGVPKDEGPDFGGFVFDCRCVPNPYREESLRELTGLDAEVQKYLIEKPEASKFAKSSDELIHQAVHAYLKRDFERLTICYGCTGGQHRSVYFAERLARELETIENVETVVTHRELPRILALQGKIEGDRS